MSLDWRRFLVVVDSSGQLLGCGQLKPHGKDVTELASIAVQPAHQKQGIARLIIEQLISKGPRPLYLVCRMRLGPFYEQWGFRPLTPGEMPAYFRRLSRLAGLFSAAIPEGDGMLVMELM